MLLQGQKIKVQSHEVIISHSSKCIKIDNGQPQVHTLSYYTTHRITEFRLKSLLRSQGIVLEVETTEYGCRWLHVLYALLVALAIAAAYNRSFHRRRKVTDCRLYNIADG